MRPFRAIKRGRWFAVGALAVALAATLTLVAQTTDSPSRDLQTMPRANRITQAVNSAEVVKLAGSVHPATRRATDLGEVNSGMGMESLTLNIGLSAAQQTALNVLLEAQQNPQSAQYHQWLTQEEYGARFGLTDGDLSQVTGWLEAEGFTVKRIAPSRNLITFSGSVAQVESTFRTQIHQYMQADGTTHIGNAVEVSIPRVLSGVVVGVHGLSGFRPKPHAIRQARPGYTLSGPQGGHLLAPGDWAAIYNVNGIYALGDTGSGEHVGVAGQTYIPLEDITAFRTAAGLSTPPPLNMVCISTADCTDVAGESVSDVGEADLDVEWSGGIAKNATVDFIYAAANDNTQGVFDALVHGITTYKVNGAILPVIGVSYGDCEFDVGSAGHAYLDGYLSEAQTQGQAIVISSGDEGAGCTTINQSGTVAVNGLSVSWPASSPMVTAVGGTTFDGDGTFANPTFGADPPYWSASNTASGTSALEYIPETSWNDTAIAGALTVSGGGVSVLYPMPSWQSGLVSGQSGGRLVPDISFTASPYQDPYLVCTQNFPVNSPNTPTSNPGSTCVNGFLPASGGELLVFGGTSVSAQVFSGMLTLLVKAYGFQGNINQTLYAYAAEPTSYATIFHDVTTGNNIVPCTAGKTGCVDDTTPPSGYSAAGYYAGYAASTGYDLATGLGSIDGYQLYRAIGLLGSLTASTTTLSALPASPSVGQSVTLTATVTGSGGTPTGTVVFTIDGTAGSALTLSGGMASTPTTFSTAGSHTVAIRYSGDSAFSASSYSGTVTVSALPAATTTVTVVPTSIPLGSSTAAQSFTATVTGSGGTPTGTVTFQVRGVAVGSATLIGGIATLTGVAPLTAKGFAVGSDAVKASYSGDGNYNLSSGTTVLTVTTPAYAITPSVTSVSLSPGGSQGLTMTMVPTTFADTVQWTARASSSQITVTPASGSVALTANTSSAAIALTIAASGSAAKHAPGLPWRGGAIVLGAVLGGVPLLRRRKGVAAVLLVLLAISAAGFMMSCGGGGGSNSPAGPRSYTVTITGSGNISSVINVTVQ